LADAGRRGRRWVRADFERPTLIVARQLLGQSLIKLEPGGRRLGGRIVETEAYIGTRDLGCHAHAGRTRRNQSMWGPAGRAYVYFTYGMHWMLNLVTEEEGFPAAVLVRGLSPTQGVPLMRRRRGGRWPDRALTDGPAKLTQALGIDRAWDGTDLCRRASRLYVHRLAPVADQHVVVGPRVGLDGVPEPWKSRPWRFRIRPQILADWAREDGAHETA
jgi:DNA-3-methyladenine glycosylase